MAKRVIGLCEGAPAMADRKQLATRLCGTLQSVAPELRSLGFDSDSMQPSGWTWDWNPDCDGPFADWISGKTVGLFWPNSEGISVICSQHATQVATGVRWDRFHQDAAIHEAVAKIVSSIGRSMHATGAWLIPDEGDREASHALDLFFENAPASALAEILQHSANAQALKL